MRKTIALAAFALLAFNGIATAGVLDAYDPYQNASRVTQQSRSVDLTPTSSIAGERETMSGFSILGREPMRRSTQPLDDHEGNCCGSSR